MKTDVKKALQLEGLSLALMLALAVVGLLLLNNLRAKTMKAAAAEATMRLAAPPAETTPNPRRREVHLDGQRRVPDCKVAQVLVKGVDFDGRRAAQGHKDGKYTAPVFVWAAYLNSQGESVRQPGCSDDWQAPVWTVHGDERVGLAVGEYPWSGDLSGPAGAWVTLRAQDPRSGVAGTLYLKLDRPLAHEQR